MLKGRLADCRHFVEMELFTEAQEAYHAAIIEHLDPRWTSQLLEEINGILNVTTPTKTDSELNPNLILTKARCKEEVSVLLKPLVNRFGANTVFKRGIDSVYYFIDQGKRDEAMDAFRSTLANYATPVWTDHNSMQFKAIMEHTPTMNIEQKEEIIIPEGEFPPILYFIDKVEGRSVERLCILEDNELKTYKKVTHNWGGVFYFVNDDHTKDTEWMRVWKLYESQQGK